MADKLETHDMAVIIGLLRDSCQALEGENKQLKEENEKLREMVADLIEADIKETMKALDVSDNDFCVRTINDFIANHQKGEKDVR